MGFPRGVFDLQGDAAKQLPAGRLVVSTSHANMERSASIETVRSSASLGFGSGDSGALPRFLLMQRLGSADLAQVQFGPELGRGSFGTVYKGWLPPSLRLDCSFCIMCYNVASTCRSQREASVFDGFFPSIFGSDTFLLQFC